jgi:exosortase/archaeosortase family protein
MLVVFFALTTAVAMLTPRSIWERLWIAGSAIPIALISNVLRITATGLVCEFASPELGEQFHDVAGLVMPVIGAALVGLELWILHHLFLDDPRTAVSVPGTVTKQRVEVNPVSLYGSSSSRRRSRRPAAPPAATPPPAPAPKAASQSS